MNRYITNLPNLPSEVLEENTEINWNLAYVFLYI